MANDDPAQAQNGQASQKQLGVQKIYVHDASLEVPNAPDIFIQQWDPRIDVQLDSSAHPVRDDLFNVTLDVTVTAKLEDKTAYLAEVRQAGVFQIAGFDGSERDLVLGAYCPNLLLPFARESLADLIQRGGFPQFLLQPVNFDALYQQKRQQQAGAKDAADPAPRNNP